MQARYFPHHSYPCPVKATLALPGGKKTHLVLRKVRHKRGSLRREAALYPLLARFGLPVPRILAGPVLDPARPKERPLMVLSLLPGADLMRLSRRDGRSLALARRLAVSAIIRMHQLTRRVAASPAARLIPRGGLNVHLKAIMRKRGPWQREPVFLDAVKKLEKALRRVDTPLVFSNGDYQPANFLSRGGRLTGFLDFEYAWFEDPLYGLAKYPIYGIQPLQRAGVVEAFMRMRGFRQAEFAPRLALACLATLSKEIPVKGGNPGYRNRVLRLLSRQLAGL